MGPFALLTVILLASSLLMMSLYLIQRRTGDAGIVDAGWAGGVGMAALGIAFLGAGDFWSRMCMAAVAVPWSFRLSAYILADRVLRGHEEDGRYAALRKRWNARAQRNFFLFFQVQALFIVLFSVPLLAASFSPGAAPRLWHFAGLILGWGAILGESLADRQLRNWRRNPANCGRTCRTGLWRYSRHPNYFFEWMHWWAYVLLAAGGMHALIALAGPLLMLLFLYRITGIPYTEQQALRSRGDDYRDYQQSTSAFFPWFPGKSAR